MLRSAAMLPCHPASARHGHQETSNRHNNRFIPIRRPWRWKRYPHPASPMLPLSVAASPLCVVLLVLCCLVTGLLADGCPLLCDCKWKSGKETVICLNASLSVIPQKLGAGTQVIDLTGNNLPTIGRDVFHNAGLLNLQKIYVAKCRIKTLDRYAFRKLINLIELDLSYNLISAVPSHVFDSISELRDLKLSGNPIQRVSHDSFVNVPQLVRLELSDCRLGTVEARAFAGLEHTLEWLKLDRNRLVAIKSSTVTAMRNLHGLELAENPWNCTCGLRPLREWMMRQNIPSGVPPVCKFPKRLSSKPWDRLDLDEFACVPEITAPETIATGVEGHNVTMSCKVGGVPEPRVRWLWRNRVIANLSGIPYSNGRKLYMVHVAEYASNLTILAADLQDAGVYVCTAENKAGKVEASVTLAVTRRPPDNGLSGRVLVASIIVAALFILALCLVILCVCTVRRRQTGVRWQPSPTTSSSNRRRDDSYEKIEMNHKAPTLQNHTRGGSHGNGGAGNALPLGGVGPVAEVSVVSGGSLGAVMKQHPRHGDYRGVPSADDAELAEDDEEEGGYEDEVETPTPTAVLGGSRDGKMMWGSTGAGAALLRSSDGDTPGSLQGSDGSEVRSSVMSDSTDLHIPRSHSYLDRRDELARMCSEDISTSGFSRSIDTTHNHGPGGRGLPHDRGISAISDALRRDVISPPLVQQHVMRKQTVGPNGGSLYTSAPLSESDSRTNTDKNYPDLLEISPFNLGASGSGLNMTDSSFCTLPRKRGGGYDRAGLRSTSRYYGGRTGGGGSDSQSPLLPESRYGSEGSGGSNASIRRSSIDSYSSSYYQLPAKHCNPTIGQQRSSSFLNLASPMEGSCMLPSRNRKNPSLPTSPVHQHTNVSSATPLLSSLVSSSVRMTDNAYPTSPSSITTAAANTYDYHAAQLERFLEEYRSLQEQLCKMKETCENIRQGDGSSRSSGRFQDPLMSYNSAVTTPSGSEDSGSNPKSILKNKTSSVAVTASSASSPMSAPSVTSPLGPSGAVDYGTDLPPYWLPRNTLLRRFSGGDFFQS